MTDLHMPTLRHAVVNDWSAIKVLLADAALPVEDLQVAMIDRFLVAEDGPDIVGLIGLQLYGTIGLLRSLVVAKSARRRGLAGKLIGALEFAAQAAGVTELWLLTIDAEEFFARHGYLLAKRDEAPPSIQDTAEFSELCPGTAYLMRKKLD